MGQLSSRFGSSSSLSSKSTLTTHLTSEKLGSEIVDELENHQSNHETSTYTIEISCEPELGLNWLKEDKNLSKDQQEKLVDKLNSNQWSEIAVNSSEVNQRSTNSTVIYKNSENSLEIDQNSTDVDESSEDDQKSTESIINYRTFSLEYLRCITLSDHSYSKSPKGVQFDSQIGPTSTQLTSNSTSNDENLNSISNISNCASTLSNLSDSDSTSLPVVQKSFQTFNTDLNELLSDDHFKDFTIKGPKKSYKVHKFVMAARCPTIFEILKNKKHLKGIKITETTDEVIEEVLEFIYDDKFPVFADFDVLLMIFDLARKLDIERLSKFSEEQIFGGISSENAINVLEIANKQNSERLKVAAFEFLKEIFPEKKLRNQILEDKEKVMNLVMELKHWKQNVRKTMEKFNKMGFFDT